MKTLLSLVQAAGVSGSIKLESPQVNHCVEIATSGTFANLVVALEGSVTGSIFGTMATHGVTGTEQTAGGAIIFVADKLAEHIRANISSYSSGCASMGTLTISGTPASGALVTIDTTAYDFRTTISTASNIVVIGGSAATALINLKLAITHGAGSGVKYSSAASHSSVTASTCGVATLIVRARSVGVAGNSIASTGTGATISFVAATLRLGKNKGTASVYYSPYPNV